MHFAFFIAAAVCLPIRITATSSNETPTRLISVDYNSYPYNDDTSPPPDDASGQESIKIENRQLYDTVKQASGYYPDEQSNNNSSHNANGDSNDKINSSTVKIFIPPRKSGVIQAIPKKIRGPGSISTSTSSPFARPSTIHATAKDFGSGEPTTTIVYATSIPTTQSRTYVNIRPVPLLSMQKYRSTIVVDNKQDKHQDTSTKPVTENFSEEQPQQTEQKAQVNVVLEKPTAFKIEPNADQATTTPRSYESTPYHIEHRKRNLYKSLPYARIRANDDIDEMPAYVRNDFVNPYPNHKWTIEDYMQRMAPPAPLLPKFMYENHQNPMPNYYQPTPPNQNLFTPRYPPPDDYQDGIYQPSPVYIPPQQQRQQQHQQQHQQQQHQQPQQYQSQQQYQPLTVRDFDLLLQLLVLRERRLHASPDPMQFAPSSEYNSESNYYYDMPKALPAPENLYYKNVREPKYIDSSISGNGQPSRLLPSNVREELLFRMFLLALQLQPQPKIMPRNPPMVPPQYMYVGQSPSSPPSSPASGTFVDYRQRNGILKNPVRSVQVLGEID